MKILVVIANYGVGHELYLERVINEYRSMRHQVDLVVLSDIPKDIGPGVRVVVGLPTKNPWSLPHGHKKIFAGAVNDYDLFIYTEDDHLVTQRHIDAFLSITPQLTADEIAGFIISERNKEGELSFCAMHGPFRWDPASVRKRGDYVIASLTNEHSGCYVITRRQLQQAIRSGGFLVEPHEGKYDLPCTAATDIYTQCGFRKVICISELCDFTVAHLPNKYVGRYGIREQDQILQVSALMEIASGSRSAETLFNPETLMNGSPWSKDCYEAVQEDVLSLIPTKAQNVLSVGCGLGNTEESLIKRGIRVVALPIDSVFSVNAQARGIETVDGSFEDARQTLSDERFDCIVLSNVLHLLADPVGTVRKLTSLLTEDGAVIITVPNHNYLGVWQKQLKKREAFGFWNYQVTGLHRCSKARVSRWLRMNALRSSVSYRIPQRLKRFNRNTLGLLSAILASEMLLVARFRPSKQRHGSMADGKILPDVSRG